MQSPAILLGLEGAPTRPCRGSGWRTEASVTACCRSAWPAGHPIPSGPPRRLSSIAAASAVILGLPHLCSGRFRRTSLRRRCRTQRRAALDLRKTAFWVQEPGAKLPDGVSPGDAPARWELSEADVEQFQRDGVIVVRGALTAWVDHLTEVIDYQVANPHMLALSASLRGAYDYVHINTWMTNNGVRDILYYSPLGHIFAQLAKTDEVRVVTDNILVNPKQSYGWHQDNQTGPVETEVALRWWAAVDSCAAFAGAPEYIRGSHLKCELGRDTSFISLDDFSESEVQPYAIEPGDLLVWDARTIHRLVIPEDLRWAEDNQRRVLSGTVAKAGALYWKRTRSGVMGDAAGHDLQDGALLQGPYFPRIYPSRIEAEEMPRRKEELVARSPPAVFQRKFQGYLEAVMQSFERSD